MQGDYVLLCLRDFCWIVISSLLNTYDDKFTSLQGSWQNQIDSLSKNTAEQAAADFKTQRDALEAEFTNFEIQLKKDLSNKLLDLNDALTSQSDH